jgi:hypothetical protein
VASTEPTGSWAVDWSQAKEAFTVGNGSLSIQRFTGSESPDTAT